MTHLKLSMARYLLASCLVLGLLSTGHAAQKLGLHGRSAMLGGELEKLTVSREGVLRLGSELEAIAELEKPLIWSAIPAPEGGLFLGVGSPAGILHVDAEGDVTVLYEPEEVLVRALAVGSDGKLYAGTSPRGRIYRIDPASPEAPVEIFADIEESYIWDMRFTEDEDLLVATGGAAGVYLLPADYSRGDASEPLLRVDERHLSTLAPGVAGSIFAGSGPSGFIYRVASTGEAFAMHHANVEEIRYLATMDGGGFVFSTFNGRSGAPMADSPNGNGSVGAATTGRDAGGAASSSGDSAPDGASGDSLIRVGADGFSRTIWSAPNQANIFSVLAASGEGWLVGTGDQGRIYEVKDQRNWSLVQSLPSGGEVIALLRHGDAIWAVGSNPGRVYRWSGSDVAGGTFTSDSLDAGQVAAWGRLEAHAEVPGSQPLPKLQTRSGNTRSPNDFWSEFAPLEDDGRIASPPARYLQVKATFSNREESLRGLDVFYRLDNQPPVVASVNTTRGAFAIFEAPPSSSGFNMKNLVSDDGEDGDDRMSPRIRLRQIRADGALTIAWQASDPNNDELRYRLEIKGPLHQGVEDWITLANDISENLYVMDLQGVDSGHYFIKVVASDAPSNPDDQAESGVLVSSPVLVDTEAPQVADGSLVQGEAPAYSFSVTDAHGRVERVEYRLNGGESSFLLPEDRLYDGSTEDFQIALPADREEPLSLVITAQDSFGNRAMRAVRLP